VDFDALPFFVASIFPVPTSSMPDKNASLRTQGPIPCLKSHLHLTALSFPSSIFPSVRPSYLSTPLLPAYCSCDEGPQTPSLSSSSSPSRFCSRPDHTCHLHRTQGPGTFAAMGLSSIPHLALQSLSSPHPGPLSLRNGRCRGQSGTQELLLL